MLFGTGLGIAFFGVHGPLAAAILAAIAHTARTVVLADAVFTATAVVLQPLDRLGLDGDDTRRCRSRGVLDPRDARALHLRRPVLAAGGVDPAQDSDMAAEAARKGKALPARYHSYFRVWFWLGWPAFIGVIAIFAADAVEAAVTTRSGRTTSTSCPGP